MNRLCEWVVMAKGDQNLPPQWACAGAVREGHPPVVQGPSEPWKCRNWAPSTVCTILTRPQGIRQHSPDGHAREHITTWSPPNTYLCFLLHAVSSSRKEGHLPHAVYV